MLIGIDTSPVWSHYETGVWFAQNDIKMVCTLKFLVQKIFFSIVFSLNPILGYGKQRRLFFGNLPGMFHFTDLNHLFLTNC